MTRATAIDIGPAGWPHDGPTVSALFREYAASLSIDLAYQGFESELAGLPGDYALPEGLCLLARVEGMPAGCGCYRPLPPTGDASDDRAHRACEMKRLFVRPPYRGLALGASLARALMRRAAFAGYDAIYLDTLDEMTAARRLYATLGFVEVAPYCFNPAPGVHFLRACLT